jgi:protein-tyrosine phosphatase
MTFIHHLFGNRKSPQPVSLEYLQTDMHSHLIPGIDDGAQDMQTAVFLVQKMKDLGYRKLVITPHIMSDIYKNTSETIISGLNELKDAVAREGIDIELEASAEYLIEKGLMELIAKEELMTMGDGFVLIELPYFNPPDCLNTIIFELQVAGYKPVLAHPERYGYWHQQFSRLEELKERGVYFQVNTISLSGYYSYPTKRIAEKLIDAGMVDFLGSDLHNHQSLELLLQTLTTPSLEKAMISGKLLNHLI